MKTKTIQNAQNFSNDSVHIAFNALMPNLILSGAKFGSPDIDDVFNSNINSVENAIQDLVSISTSQVGEIVIRDTNNSPSGFPQVDHWQFTSLFDVIYDEDTFINILGKKVEMVSGSTIENITVETQKVIQDYVDEGIFFKSVKLVDNTTLEVEYIDLRSHDPLISNDSNSFTVTKTVIRDVMFGYGQWEYMGSVNVTLDKGERTLYYFRRIG